MLRIYGVAIEMLKKLRPVIERVKAKDDNLADQLRDSLDHIIATLHRLARR